METIVEIISFTLLMGLFVCPIIISRQLHKRVIRYTFIVYLIVGTLATAAIAFTFGWWTNYSDKKLLDHLGYHFDAMNDKERFENVAPDNMEKVKSIEKGRMGIGWPLKVIMSYIFYTPYLLLVYFVGYYFRKRSTKTVNNK